MEQLFQWSSQKAHRDFLYTIASPALVSTKTAENAPFLVVRLGLVLDLGRRFFSGIGRLVDNLFSAMFDVASRRLGLLLDGAAGVFSSFLGFVARGLHVLLGSLRHG